ncbi:MAG: hypothetical protein K2L12_06445 [Clostridia bacterium]|nr:hypothetical protein [Clostridia bacterium]
MNNRDLKQEAPPCGCIPKREIDKWRFEQLSRTIANNVKLSCEIPLAIVDEYNSIGVDLYHWNSGKAVPSVLPDGKVIVGYYGTVGRRGDLLPYYEYDEARCFPCARCKGKKPGEYGLDGG